MPTTHILVADFGGTHARAALAEVNGMRVTLGQLRAQDLDPAQTPADWLAAYLREIGQEIGGVRIDACAACAAGPLETDGTDTVVRFTNRKSEIRVSALAKISGRADARLLNDFAALAHALAMLGEGDIADIAGGGSPVPGAAQLLIGPGTGLGVAIRVPTSTADSGSALVLPGEGGHSALAAFDGETRRLWPHLVGTREQLSAEHLISGPGLKVLYAACAAESGLVADKSLGPSLIAERGLAATDAVCARAVRLFTRWLGHFAGGLALIAGARGGVYIGGGIIPAWGDRFDAAAFRAAFEAQPEQRDYVAAIPTRLLQHPQPTLVGLAAVANGY